MSTFSGRIKEIPDILVDRFILENNNSKLFFLSHCHRDHMEGLQTIEFKKYLNTNENVYLYASSISIRILKNIYDSGEYCNKQLLSKLKVLSWDCATLIKLTSGDEVIHLKVTTIPAGHCLGSVMFLFETNKTVLYTGDFRINAKDLPKYKEFHNSDGTVKKIDKMYLDTTFCKERFNHFPSREQSINEVCKLIDEWIGVSNKHIVQLRVPSYYGSENLFLEIYRRTNKSIHPMHEPNKLYKYVKEMDKVFTPGEKNSIKIHTMLNYNNKCCNYNINDKFVRTIKVTAWFWENYEPGESIVSSSEDEYRVCYSSHASFQEIREFVTYLKPFCIEPCVVPFDMDEQQECNRLLMNIMKEYKK